VTEGVIYVVALACTLIVLCSPDPTGAAAAGAPSPPIARQPMRLSTLVALGWVAAMLSIAADWAVVRAIYGDRFAGHAGFHVRFGPGATVNRPEYR
jgi:hypothetical protein